MAAAIISALILIGIVVMLAGPRTFSRLGLALLLSAVGAVAGFTVMYKLLMASDQTADMTPGAPALFVLGAALAGAVTVPVVYYGIRALRSAGTPGTDDDDEIAEVNALIEQKHRQQGEEPPEL